MITLHKLKEGAIVKGDHGLPTDQMPLWLDKKKFYEAKKIFKKYFFSLFFAHLAGLIFTINIPSITTTLLTTGKSSSLVEIFRRYLDTLLHIKMWYEGDIWNPEDPAYKSITFVRKIHNIVAKKVNGSKKQKELALSQFEMALGQYTFVGLVIFYPKQIGISCNKEDLDCLIHFWRGVGYQLGIHDEYNMCTNGLIETKKICRDILDEVIKPTIMQTTQDGSIMSQNIVKAVNIFIPFLSFESLMRFWFEIIHIPKNLKINKHQILEYWLMKMTFKLIFFSTFVRIFFNNLLRIALRKVVHGRKVLEY